MFQFHPNNPFRSTAWRWELARTVREKKVRAKHPDKWVTTAVRFQTDLDRCADDVDRWTLMETHPALYAAYLIYSRGGADDRHPIRFALEARILSGQPAHAIADLAGIAPETVDAYENVFFNVKDKLRHPDYIMTCVLGPSVHAGLSDRDYDLLWKLFGYLYGPAALDAFISTTSRKFRPQTLGEVDAALADDARSALQRKVAIAARTFTLNPFSQSELLNIYARFLEVEKESNSGKAQDVILSNISVMLDKMPWQAGKENLSADPQLAEYDSGGVELRTGELIALTAGTAPGPRPATELTFPQPEKKVPNAKPVN